MVGGWELNQDRGVFIIHIQHHAHIAVGAILLFVPKLFLKVVNALSRQGWPVAQVPDLRGTGIQTRLCLKRYPHARRPDHVKDSFNSLKFPPLKQKMLPHEHRRPQSRASIRLEKTQTDVDPHHRIHALHRGIP